MPERRCILALCGGEAEELRQRRRRFDMSVLARSDAVDRSSQPPSPPSARRKVGPHRRLAAAPRSSHRGQRQVLQSLVLRDFGPPSSPRRRHTSTARPPPTRPLARTPISRTFVTRRCRSGGKRRAARVWAPPARQARIVHGAKAAHAVHHAVGRRTRATPSTASSRMSTSARASSVRRLDLPAATSGAGWPTRRSSEGRPPRRVRGGAFGQPRARSTCRRARTGWRGRRRGRRG